MKYFNTVLGIESVRLVDSLGITVFESVLAIPKEVIKRNMVEAAIKLVSRKEVININGCIFDSLGKKI
jgi:uncharacterized protein (DUF486 family)